MPEPATAFQTADYQTTAWTARWRVCTFPSLQRASFRFGETRGDADSESAPL
jgi:hypothetical protein